MFFINKQFDFDGVLSVMLFVSTEEDFLLSQAALLEQMSNLQPLLDSTYVRGELYSAATSVLCPGLSVTRFGMCVS